MLLSPLRVTYGPTHTCRTQRYRPFLCAFYFITTVSTVPRTTVFEGPSPSHRTHCIFSLTREVNSPILVLLVCPPLYRPPLLDLLSLALPSPFSFYPFQVQPSLFFFTFRTCHPQAETILPSTPSLPSQETLWSDPVFPLVPPLPNLGSGLVPLQRSYSLTDSSIPLPIPSALRPSLLSPTWLPPSFSLFSTFFFFLSPRSPPPQSEASFHYRSFSFPFSLRCHPPQAPFRYPASRSLSPTPPSRPLPIFT